MEANGQAQQGATRGEEASKGLSQDPVPGGGTSDWESAGVEGSPSRGRPDLRSILLTYGRAFGVGEATELLSGLESALLREASIVGRAAAWFVYGTVVDECLSEV